MGRKRAAPAAAAAEDADKQPREPHDQPPPAARQKTARREEQAAIARRRAAHFANFGGEEDEADADGNVHVGKNEARTLGPWSSAVELVNARQAAADERNTKLQQQQNEQPDDVAWEPARDPSLGPRPIGAVPTLFSIAMRLLVQHIGAVSSLWGVPDSIRSQIAGAVAAQRKLSSDVALLFGHDAPTELVIPDCHQLDPPAMLALLRLLLHGIEPGSEAGGGSAEPDSASREGTPAAGEGAAHRLERLVLGSCGRGFDAKAAAALAGAGPLQALRVLHLGGAFKLADEGLLALLKAAPGLQELSVPSAPRLTGAFLAQLPALVPALTCLDLAHCGGLSGADLAPLLSNMVGLQRLVLDGIDEVDDQVLAAAGRAPRLRSLSVAFCRGVGDEALAAFASARAGSQVGLQVLVLDDCTAVGDAGLSALLDGGDGCKQLSRLSLAHCTKVTDAPLVALAELGALEALSLNSLQAIGPPTLQALAKGCGDVLQELDVSFCRGVTEGALGALVDRCSRLQVLSVYSCTQLTQRFLFGHGRDGLLVHGVPTSCL